MCQLPVFCPGFIVCHITQGPRIRSNGCRSSGVVDYRLEIDAGVRRSDQNGDRKHFTPPIRSAVSHRSVHAGRGRFPWSIASCKLFTIGHSNHAAELFLELLQRHRIEEVLDVRSSPHSRFNPQFNRRRLKTTLEEAGVGYGFMGDGLGGRPADSSCYDREGRVQYDRLAETDAFKDGIGQSHPVGGRPPHSVNVQRERAPALPPHAADCPGADGGRPWGQSHSRRRWSGRPFRLPWTACWTGSICPETATCFVPGNVTSPTP